MIDLHVHSTVSDGSFTPTEIIRHAKEIGLKAVALTDHDSIEGHEEAAKEADKLGMIFVKGIEFSATYSDSRQFHILGLGIEPECEGFMKPYLKYRQSRDAKVEYVFEQLRLMGVTIDRKSIEPYTAGAYMDRQAMAKYLVAKGYAPIMKRAWMDYLDKIPSKEGEVSDPKSSIDMIHAAGGKAFLAHLHIPIGMEGYSYEETRSYLQWLKDLGLDGLECYYPTYTKEEKDMCEAFAEEFNFLKSGGSDFHGSNRAHIALGTGEGDLSVPDELLEHII